MLWEIGWSPQGVTIAASVVESDVNPGLDRVSGNSRRTDVQGCHMSRTVDACATASLFPIVSENK